MAANSVLLIAFEMPPARSAGVQRPYRFAEYLLELGWDPYILTATSDVYQRFDHELQVPAALAGRIYRAKASDISKKIAIAGRSPDFLAVPDRFWPWYFPAVELGNSLVRDKNIQLLWSTYPVMTSHLIGRKLSLRHQLPWVADFRDPLQCHYNPAYQHFNRIQRYLERKVMLQASKVVTTCEAAAQLYRRIYPQLPADKFNVIENGYVPTQLPDSTRPDRFTLLYSGALYGNGRDVSPLFQAISDLKQHGIIDGHNFVLKFRGSAKAEKFASELQRFGISELVEFLPAVPFAEAQAEMMGSSANLLIQDEIFNYQVPGKLYDYVQSAKPLLAICPPDSATADVCRRVPDCLRVWQSSEIKNALQQLINRPATDTVTVPESFSRFQGAVQLAALLTQLSSQTAQRN